MKSNTTKKNMVQIKTNPFSRLENAEIQTGSEFVELFSPYAVNSCSELYKSGNVIISGIEGSGKSMLLNLLKPEIRISYYKNQAEFPVSGKFLGAGINFTRSSLIDIGSRIVSRLEFGKGRKKDAPLYFGDFINYWVVRDIIYSVITFKKELKGGDLFKVAGLDCSTKKESAFVKFLSASPSWLGSLDGVQDMEELLNCLSERIIKYRRIATESHPQPISDDIGDTLTEIRQPISQTAEMLYKSGMLEAEIPVLIRFDQYEDLFDAVDFDPEVAEQYRQVVNKFLWSRDPNVSFKIGSRPYALLESLKVFQLASQLELARDYTSIDLDEKLRRPENSSTWIFKKLAEDVFTRRFKRAEYPKVKMLNFFGSTMSPHKKAQIVVNNEGTRERMLIKLTGIDESHLKFLIDLAVGKKPASSYGYFRDENDAGDLLSAKLGAAWYLQGKEFELPLEQAPTGDTQAYILPWDSKKAVWWKKERINQALLQISSSAGQRMHWSGKHDILTLSGSNILIFLNICREIWIIWEQLQRINDSPEIDFGQKPVVDPKHQSAGIYAVSSLWYNKVAARTKGHSRKRLIDKIGKEFSKKLSSDIKMSYPGNNGFSLTISDFNNSKAKPVITNAVRYGDLVELPHTPKNKDQEKRKKWYLLPILSPMLALPVSHTKEPFYMHAKTIEEWIADARKPNENELRQ